MGKGEQPGQAMGQDDTQISFVDGRAERLRPNLDKALNELQPKVDPLSSIDLLDTEEDLGYGEKFKQDAKILRSDAKVVSTAISDI